MSEQRRGELEDVLTAGGNAEEIEDISPRLDQPPGLHELINSKENIILLITPGAFIVLVTL